MNKLLTMVGLVAILALGCDSVSPVSDQGAAAKTTVASILTENKATATYGVSGMT